MCILPDPTNQHYRGALWACGVLALAALHAIASGGASVLLPDSGLITLAGLSLAHEGGLQMVAMAAIAGATQLVWGLSLALVAWRYRSLTGLFLMLVVLEKTLVIIGGLVKPTNSAATMPGADISLGLLILCLLALYGARPKSD